MARFVCGVLAFFATSTAVAVERLFIQMPAVYAESRNIRQAIKDECSVDTMLATDVLQAAKTRIPNTYPLTAETDAPEPGDKVLKLTILEAEGVGGGGWSGAKSLTIQADLMQNGQIVRSVIKRAHSRIGKFGFMSGVCSIIKRTSRSLGSHMARWLLSPTAKNSDPQEVQDIDPDKPFPSVTPETPANSSSSLPG